MASERASQQSFFGVAVLLFAASAAVTIVWCTSMSAMGEMPDGPRRNDAALRFGFASRSGKHPTDREAYTEAKETIVAEMLEKARTEDVV